MIRKAFGEKSGGLSFGCLVSQNTHTFQQKVALNDPINHWQWFITFNLLSNPSLTGLIFFYHPPALLVSLRSLWGNLWWTWNSFCESKSFYEMWISMRRMSVCVSHLTIWGDDVLDASSNGGLNFRVKSPSGLLIIDGRKNLGYTHLTAEE